MLFNYTVFPALLCAEMKVVDCFVLVAVVPVTSICKRQVDKTVGTDGGFVFANFLLLIMVDFDQKGGEQSCWWRLALVFLSLLWFVV